MGKQHALSGDSREIGCKSRIATAACLNIPTLLCSFFVVKVYVNIIVCITSSCFLFYNAILIYPFHLRLFLFFNSISPREKHQQLPFTHSVRQFILIRCKHSHRDCMFVFIDKLVEKTFYAQIIILIFIAFNFANWNAKNNNNDRTIFSYNNNCMQ